MADRQLELFAIEPSAGASPVPGREFEVPVARPVRQDADDIREVCLDVELVQDTRGDEGEDVGGGAGVVAGAEKEPGLASDRDRRPEGSLGGIVVDAESAVVEETSKRVALANHVAEGAGSPATGQHHDARTC